jgi:hypothetical protein
MLFSRKLQATVLTVAGLGVFAGSAHAAVIDTDSVKLTSQHVDFGDDWWGIGGPLGSGELSFEYSGGKITPHLKGTIHLDDADGMCGKMRMEAFDAAGTMLDRSYGGEVCAHDDSHHAWDVDLAPYSDASIASVEVAIDEETANGWFTMDKQTYVANTFSDDVKIKEDGVDLGGNTFGLSDPSSPGTMYWNLHNGVSTPHLVATIWLNNSGGECARVNLRYLTDGGSELTQKHGGTICAAGNSLQGFGVDLDPYSSNKIGKVDVQLQTEGTNGNYTTVGSQTVSIAE